MPIAHKKKQEKQLQAARLQLKEAQTAVICSTAVCSLELQLQLTQAAAAVKAAVKRREQLQQLDLQLF